MDSPARSSGIPLPSRSKLPIPKAGTAREPSRTASRNPLPQHNANNASTLRPQASGKSATRLSQNRNEQSLAVPRRLGQRPSLPKLTGLDESAISQGSWNDTEGASGEKSGVAEETQSGQQNRPSENLSRSPLRMSSSRNLRQTSPARSAVKTNKQARSPSMSASRASEKHDATASVSYPIVATGKSPRPPKTLPPKPAIPAKGQNMSSRPGSIKPSRPSLPSTDGDSGGLSRNESCDNSTKSSASLRQTIAAAKAARMAQIKASKDKATMPGQSSSFAYVDGLVSPELEPFSGSKGIAQRLSSARKSGNLLLTSLGLKEIPSDVLKLYEFDPAQPGNWYENVDLTKCDVSDNDIAEIGDAFFPDIDFVNQPLDDEVEVAYSPFCTLKVLYLQGNLLRGLPIGISRLDSLSVLNLSSNKLNMTIFSTLSGLRNLRELRLARNELHGELSPSVGLLKSLEVLELHENSITDIGDSLDNLSNLRLLNLSKNKISSLSFHLLGDKPLVELDVSQNRLVGTLFPGPCPTSTSLRCLVASDNSLDELASSDLDLGNLQQLSAERNQLTCLPRSTSWPLLTSINVAQNKLACLPEGFVALSKLRVADFSANQIETLHEGIGLMDSLTTLNVYGNPLRERRLLKMSTEQLKANTNQRVVAANEASTSISTTQTSDYSNTQVKAGVLDLSSRGLRSFEIDSLGLEDEDIAQIRTLKLSNNALGPEFPSSRLELPSLRDLHIDSIGLQSLDRLIEELAAPSLVHLDVSRNLLTGTLPCLRSRFPSLTVLVAAENRIEQVDVEAVSGLRELDVRNNELSFLEPRIGLLGGEHTGGLQRLDVAGNRFRVPGWQVINKGSDAVLAWLRMKIPAE